MYGTIEKQYYIDIIIFVFVWTCCNGFLFRPSYTAFYTPRIGFARGPLFPQAAVIAQLGERQTEDLKVPGSIPGRGIFFYIIISALSTLMNFDFLLFLEKCKQKQLGQLRLF